MMKRRICHRPAREPWNRYFYIVLIRVSKLLRTSNDAISGAFGGAPSEILGAYNESKMGILCMSKISNGQFLDLYMMFVTPSIYQLYYCTESAILCCTSHLIVITHFSEMDLYLLRCSRWASYTPQMKHINVSD